jgi:hypothetical protein
MCAVVSKTVDLKIINLQNWNLSKCGVVYYTCLLNKDLIR